MAGIAAIGAGAVTVVVDGIMAATAATGVGAATAATGVGAAMVMAVTAATGVGAAAAGNVRRNLRLIRLSV